MDLKDADTLVCVLDALKDEAHKSGGHSYESTFVLSCFSLCTKLSRHHEYL